MPYIRLSMCEQAQKRACLVLAISSDLYVYLLHLYPISHSSSIKLARTVTLCNKKFSIHRKKYPLRVKLPRQGGVMKTRLKELRKLRGYKSARAFAASIGMQENTYRKYEQEERNLYLDVACRLCDALDCSLDDLAGRKRPEVETELIEILRNISPEGQKQLIIYARGIAQTYSKNRQVEKTA